MAGGVAGAVAAGWALVGGEFAAQHLGALAAAGVAIGLGARVALGAAAVIASAARRRQRLGESGAAMVEFVIAGPPFLLCLLALFQLALCSFARLMVSHAAFCAARAAVV